MSRELFDVVRLLKDIGLANALGFLLPGVAPVKAKATDYTVQLQADRPGTIFTTYGAAGAVTFTLPTPTVDQLGVTYKFVNLVAQNMLVASATADTLGVINDLAADSLAAQTSNQQIGAVINAVCVQTGASTYQWLLENVQNGVTGTVVTA
jgi:hypothetical protein